MLDVSQAQWEATKPGSYRGEIPKKIWKIATKKLDIP